MLIFGRLARRAKQKYMGGAPGKAPRQDYCVTKVYVLFPGKADPLSDSGARRPDKESTYGALPKPLVIDF